MHPYYGSSQLVHASPTLVTSIVGMEAMASTSNDAFSNISPLSPPVSPPQANLQSTNTIFPGASGAAGQYQLLPPISTATQSSPIFRSPSSFTQTSMMPSTSFQFVSPTHSSPPIQMTAPVMTTAGLTSTTDTWQNVLPSHIAWVPELGAEQKASLSARLARCSVNSSCSRQALLDRLRGLNTAMNAKGLKRKASLEECLVDIPGKVHINEERMAARMQGLTLDNNNLDWHPDLEEQQWYNQGHMGASESPPARPASPTPLGKNSMDDSDGEAQLLSPDSTAGLPRLEFSDILKIQPKTQEILPKAILDEINKPNMQVVLWKPPGNVIPDVIKSKKSSEVKLAMDSSEAVSLEESRSPNTRKNRQPDILLCSLLSENNDCDNSFHPVCNDDDDMEL